MIDRKDFILKSETKCSRKCYRHFCDNCNSDLGYRRIDSRWTGYCRECFNKVTHTNKIVSDETRQKMSKNHYLKNGGKHPLAGKKHTRETKAKISKAATHQSKKYKGNYLYSGSKGNINMRSSWEVKYANWLDFNNIDWIYEPIFKLSNGKLYTPDFKLEDGTIIEIKGYFRKDAMEKWLIFSKEYPHINKQILMKSELKDLGVL